MGEEAVALGVKTAGLQSTTLQAAVPPTTHQLVVDVWVTGGGEKHQPIRLMHTQVLHLPLVLSQGLKHLRSKGHHTLLARLGGSPLNRPAGIPTTPQALHHQHLSLFPADAIPGQATDYGISQPVLSDRRNSGQYQGSLLCRSLSNAWLSSTLSTSPCTDLLFHLSLCANRWWFPPEHWR